MKSIDICALLLHLWLLVYYVIDFENTSVQIFIPVTVAQLRDVNLLLNVYLIDKV